jgi:cysteine-rich repeat protein
MRQSLFWSLALLFLLSTWHVPQSFAAFAVHSWTSPAGNHSIEVDNQGGSFNNDNCDSSDGGDNTYHFELAETRISSTFTFFLYNGTAVDDGADPGDDGVDNDCFSGDSTGEDFSPTSALTLFDPFTGLPPLTQVSALSDSPLAPASFHGNQTGLDVQQLTYVQDGKDFVIFEYNVTNNTGNAVPVKIAMAHDMDIADTNSDDQNEVDTGIPMVSEHDTIANGDGKFYAAGMAVAGGNLDNFRLGACCDLTFENNDSLNNNPILLDVHRLAYFRARPNEECDDGNTDNNDACSNNCKTKTGGEVCGNGTVEAGEGCDDGGTSPGDGCDANCLSETCGDNNLDPEEECDDGNLTDGDSCSSYCTVEFVDGGHFCGDGTPNGGAVGIQQTVPADNEVEISIDLGTLEPGQSTTGTFCVVGGISDVDGATANANAAAAAQECKNLYQTTITVCGNGIQNADEECDDGNTTDDDGCDGNCTFTACGNGLQTSGEECDDGNIQNGDGCDDACQVEAATPPPDDGGCSLGVDAESAAFLRYLLAVPILLGLLRIVGRHKD